MSAIKDGGAAFPTFAPGSEAHDPGSIFEEGMTLRDYFALPNTERFCRGSAFVVTR